MSEINDEQEKKALELREKLAKDFDEDKAKKFGSSHENKSWYEDFKILLEMVTTKEYTISNQTKMIIAGTLAYVVLPIDVIPDFLPVVGWLDDIFVLGLATNTLTDEIENFKKFKEEHNV